MSKTDLSNMTVIKRCLLFVSYIRRMLEKGNINVGFHQQCAIRKTTRVFTMSNSERDLTSFFPPNFGSLFLLASSIEQEKYG